MSSRPPTRFRLERGEISLQDRVAEVKSTAETLGAPLRPPATDQSWRGATCNYCGAPIIWCTTRNYKRMPVDVDTHPQGNVRITAGPCAEVYGPLERLALGEELHMPHHATCPFVDQWAKRPAHDARRDSVASPVPPPAVPDELAAARARRALRQSQHPAGGSR